MRKIILLAATTLGSIAFQISVALWPESLRQYAWAVKYVWMLCGAAWLILLVTHPKIIALINGPARNDSTVPGHSPISINVSPTISPNISPTIGFPDTVKEQKREERLVLEFMRRTHPTAVYAVSELSANTGFPADDVREILQRLEAKELVFHVDTLDLGREWFVRDIE